MSLEAFTRAYIACALWSSTDNSDSDTGGEPLDNNYGPDDLHDIARTTMEADCASFYNDPNNSDDIELWREAFGTDEQAGNDFWLTRTGHGAGFWDRFYGDNDNAKAGDRLSGAARSFGPVDLYIGDDSLIYHG